MSPYCGCKQGEQANTSQKLQASKEMAKFDALMTQTCQGRPPQLHAHASMTFSFKKQGLEYNCFAPNNTGINTTHPVLLPVQSKVVEEGEPASQGRHVMGMGGLQHHGRQD